jgi:trehalose utilization protein
MKHHWLCAVALFGLLTLAQAQPVPPAESSAAAPAPLEWGPGLKVLIVAGGYGHDFANWAHKFDTALLHKSGITSTHYTEDPAVAARELPHIDVLLMSNNYRHFDTLEFRDALSNYVNAGKGGLVLLHSTVYYSWDWWPFYKLVVGGGARIDEGAAPIEVTVLKDHPVTHGLPATFQITDELYQIVPIPGASPMEILAEAYKPGGPKYPSIWLVHYNDKTRIVCIALGHDSYPRQSPVFSTLLINAVKWAGGE